MSVACSVADVLRNHVTLEVEGIDRMYLNADVPILHTPEGVAHFLRFHLTPFGLRTALFWTRSYARRLRPGMAALDPLAPGSSRLQRALTQVQQTVANTIHDLKRAS